MNCTQVNFYIALAGEKDPVRVLKIIRQYMKPNQRIFVGVTGPIDPRVETPEEVRDAFRKYVNPKSLVIVRAGDFSKK